MGNSIDVAPRYWPCADNRETDGDVDMLYTDAALGHESAINELPQEFYLHELMGIDAADDKAVEAFAREWGMPYHPVRYCDIVLESLIMLEAANRQAHDCMLHDEDFAPYRSVDAFLGDTEKAAHRLAWKERQSMQDSAERCIHNEPFGACVSLSEAAAAITFMQRASNCLIRFRGGETLLAADKTVLYSIAQCTRYPFEIYFDGLASYGNEFSSTIDGIPPFSITNAIANQLFKTAKDDTPYRRCAWCGRSFKYRRSSTTKPAKTTRKQSSSIYCCQKCYQSMKDYRKGDIKNPPDWWTPEQAEDERNKGKRKR